MLAIADSGSTPRYGPTARSLNAAAAASGSRFATNSPLHSRDRRRLEPALTPNTSSRFDAGSVEMMSVRLPASASATATALAVVVFPTPPLPVKNR